MADIDVEPVAQPPRAQRIPSAAPAGVPVAGALPPAGAPVVGGTPDFGTAGDFGGGALISTAALERRRAPGMPLWQKITLTLVFISIVGGLAFGGLMLFRFAPGVSDAPSDSLMLKGYVYLRKSTRDQAQAFSLALPKNLWQRKESLKNRFKAVVALERAVKVEGQADPVLAWLVVDAADYGQQRPRDAELLQRMLQRLEACFGEQLEVAAEPEMRTFADQPAQVLTFRGEIEGVFWTGEALAFTNHGFGYWLFLAAPQLEVAQVILADLQRPQGMGFRLDDRRHGWTEQPPALDQFVSIKDSLKLAAPEGQWKSFPNPQDYDANGILYLNGRDLQDLKNNVKGAHVLVLKLERPSADLNAAADEARKYVEAKYKEVNDKYQLAPVDEKAKAAEADKLGNQFGRLRELKLLRDNDPIKYVLLGVVREPEYIYVIRCESVWDYHSIWRNEFRDLLNTLKVK